MFCLFEDEYVHDNGNPSKATSMGMGKKHFAK